MFSEQNIQIHIFMQENINTHKNVHKIVCNNIQIHIFTKRKFSFFQIRP